MKKTWCFESDVADVEAFNMGEVPADEEAALEGDVAESVTAVLRQYRHNARALGGGAADDWAKAHIASETDRLVPQEDDGEWSQAWQRVHDEIRRLFNRYVVHVDDGELMPDGDYEVFIKGWTAWAPARIENGGRTWKLPVGRVSADGIESTVAAIRPAA